ncbi:MAG: YraN family protein [Woeseia sp.]|nr:YraN family protein [Woeseia sp.]NNE61279.1 YraN family protein [Woeseia sp.]NNL53513.1 YraN family protein [Woeseia sp.]
MPAGAERLPHMHGRTATKGARAEVYARKFLERHGLRYVDRNIRCRFGEIDLVMRSDQLLVFAEVRFRRARNLISAVESIDRNKQRKLAQTASWYLSRSKRWQSCAVRFDVVAIDGRSDGQYALQWIQDAFRPGA